MKSKKNKKQNTEAKQHSVPHHCLSLERRTYLFERYGLTSLLDGTPEPQPLPQETTEVEIPWDYVTFHDGYACIFHPKYYNEIGKPYIRINGNKIKRSFNRVSELFIKRLPNIVVKCCGRKMLSIVKLPEFWECITILDQPSLIPDFILTAGVPPKKLRGISRDLLGRLIQKDLEYVRYLCSRQLCNHKAYYIL